MCERGEFRGRRVPGQRLEIAHRAGGVPVAEAHHRWISFLCADHDENPCGRWRAFLQAYRAGDTRHEVLNLTFHISPLLANLPPPGAPPRVRQPRIISAITINYQM